MWLLSSQQGENGRVSKGVEDEPASGSALWEPGVAVWSQWWWQLKGHEKQSQRDEQQLSCGWLCVPC